MEVYSESSLSDEDGRPSLSSVDSSLIAKSTPQSHIPNLETLDNCASSEILSTPSMGISLLPIAPQAQPPCPSDPNVVKNIEVLAAFVVKNGPHFEDMAREKQAKDPKFQFLFGGEAGSEASVGYNFYEWKKGELLSMSASGEHTTTSLQGHQKLNPESHDQSELLQSNLKSRFSSDASEMHNDDIDQFLPSPQSKSVKAQDSFSGSTLRDDRDHFKQREQWPHADDFTTSRDIYYPAPRRRDTRRRTGFDRQSMKDVDTLPDLARPIQQDLSPAVDEENRSLVSDDHDIETSARCSESLEQRNSQEMKFYMKEKQSSQISSDEKQGNLQIHQVETFRHFEADLYYKRNEPTRDTERFAQTMDIGRPKDHHSMKSAQSGSHTVDEFGRLFRQGVNDSDSDEHNSRRKRRRSASRSRSRSPGGSRRRRQSPGWSPRRRGNYHPSYSRSPTQHRSQSPTPPWEVRRGSDWREDRGSFGRGRRGGRRGGPVPPCYDFTRGRCFRGSSCRFIHLDTHGMPGDSSEKTFGAGRARWRRDEFIGHEGTVKDESWPTVGRGTAPRLKKAADVTEGWSWPDNGMEKSDCQNAGFKIQKGFSTQDPESIAILESVSAAFTAEISVLNVPKPSCSASLSDNSQIALSPRSCGTNTKSQPAPLQATYLSTFASLQTSPLPSTPKVSFHQHQTLPSLPPPPPPPPPPLPLRLPPPPPPPRLPPPPPPTQVASFSPPTRAPGVPAGLPVADQLSEQTPMFSGRSLTSNVSVSWNPLSQEPVAAGAVGAPPASMPGTSGMLSFHQHATNAALPSAHTGLMVPALHNSVSAPLPEQQRLPSPTPASQRPFNNVFSLQQGFAPPSSSPPQYGPGAGKQQEIAPNYPTSFSGVVSHQQKDAAYHPLSKHSTLARNSPQQVLSHKFINSNHLENTEIMTSHSRPASERHLTNQHLSTPDTTHFSDGACLQAFTSASGPVSVSYNPLGMSESGMDILPQSSSTGISSSSLTHNNYLLESVQPEPDGANLMNKSLGTSFHQAVPSFTISSLGTELKSSGVNIEPVCPEEPMSPGPAAGGMQSVNPEPPGDLVMESVSPGLPVRAVQHEMNITQTLTHLPGNSAVENDSSSLELKNNSPNNVGAHAAEHGVERANLNLEDGQDRSKKDKDGKPAILLRVAVTEYVKEVLKPTWKEGHMSKEAFKTIAKKAVDKVLGALQSHQVPKTQDKVDHFMSFSRQKIANLVQSYVEKYVKMT